MKNLHHLFAGIILLGMSACNQSGTTGNQTTPEGTTVTNRVNSDMEDHRTPADVDTITSPGSNSTDLNTTNSGASGTDPNMQNQGNTHGRSTTTGDNGTNSGQ